MSTTIATPLWPSTTNITTVTYEQNTSLSTSDFIVVTIYIIILVFGFSGNLIVVHYFGFRNKVRRLYHIYLIHLAIADLISATVTSVYFMLSVVSGYTWYLGEFSCKLISIIAPVTVNVSAWLLVSIAHERYRGIISPFKPRLTKLRIHLTVAAIWFVSFLILTPYALSVRLSEGWCRMSWSSPVYELTYAVVTLVFQSLLPIIYMTFTVTRILHVLRNRMTEGNVHVSTRSKLSNFSRETSFMSNSFHTSTTTKYSSSQEIQRGEKQHCTLMEENSPCQQNSPHLTYEQPSPNTHRQQNLSPISLNSTISQLRTESKAKTLSVPSLVVAMEYSVKNKQKLYEVADCSPTNLEPLLKKTQSVLLSRKKFSQNDSPTYFDIQNTSENKQTRSRSPSVEETIPEKPFSTAPSFRRGGSVRITEPRSNRGSIYRKFCKLFTSDSKTKGNPVRQQQRIAMLVVTFSVFVVCSLPYNMFYVAAIVIYDFVKDHTQLDLLRHFHVWLSTLVVSNSIMNCFIYAGMDKGFQTYCKRIITCKCGRKEDIRRIGRGSPTRGSIRRH
eukprot:TCONS_00018111-protein